MTVASCQDLNFISWQNLACASQQASHFTTTHFAPEAKHQSINIVLTLPQCLKHSRNSKRYVDPISDKQHPMQSLTNQFYSISTSASKSN